MAVVSVPDTSGLRKMATWTPPSDWTDALLMAWRITRTDPRAVNETVMVTTAARVINKFRLRLLPVSRRT